MATPLRFFRRRRRQPRGGATPKTSFFGPTQHPASTPGDAFFAPSLTWVQPKLTVNQPGDAHEQEADKMADHVVQRAAMKPDDEKIQRRAKHEEEDHVQRKPDDEKIQKKDAKEDEKPIQKKDEKVEKMPVQKKAAVAAAPSAAPVSAHQLNATKGQGSPLPASTQAEMAQAFGHDFRNVRIHTTSQAEQLSQALRAQAFTHGKDVYFNRGNFNPETTEGKRLLAHELTHVVQQNATDLPVVQRYAVPASLPCTDVVDWLNTNSPYAPEWAETRCTYSFNGQLRVQFETLADNTVRATATGSPRLSVAKTCPIDGPTWSPSARPNQAAERAAWQSMKSTLNAHEQQHRQIGEQQRVVLQTNYRAVNLTATGSDRADALAQLQQQVSALQQQWVQDAQAAQDAIDPFRGAVLSCP